MFNRSEINVGEALEIREEQEAPLFFCVSCGERVKPHSGGVHMQEHFEHFHRNSDCPLSGGTERLHNPDSDDAIEGYAKERRYLSHHRNAAIVLSCKERDNYTCKACGLSLRVNGRSIIECHHLVPLASAGKRLTILDELICLCPTCHRVAHTSNPPLLLEKIIEIIG